MRKIILLCMMIFVGTVNGMEQPKQTYYSKSFWRRSLPTDVKEILNNYIKHQDSFVGVVNEIKATSHTNPKLNKMVNQKYGDQEAFTSLVHILEHRFDTNPNNVAKQFETAASYVYLSLVEQLTMAIMNRDKSRVVELIKDGADINFIDNRGATPLGWAVRNSDIVQILLDAGARVRADDIAMLSINIRCYQGSPDWLTEQFKSLVLLEKALQQQKKEASLNKKRKQIIC